MIPKYITHYHLPDRKPFLNLSALAEDELNKVLEGLRKLEAERKTSRGFPDWYMESRRKTEIFLREEFIKKGGKPEKMYPHYFCLGENNFLEKGTFRANGKAKKKAVKIKLGEISPNVISFTLPDSMATFLLKDEEDCKPWHGEVLTLEEITNLIQEIGFPKEEFIDVAKGKRFISFIEAQLWSDEPVMDYLV